MAITAPTVVIYGTADPLFPLAHGQALADAAGRHCALAAVYGF